MKYKKEFKKLISCFFHRSLREDLSAVQQPAYRQEEDPREEANPEPGLQRVLRVRPAQERGRAGQRPARVHAARLGSRHQERGFQMSSFQSIFWPENVDYL